MSDVQINQNKVHGRNNDLKSTQNQTAAETGSEQAIFDAAGKNTGTTPAVKETIEEKENERIVTTVSEDGVKTVRITSKIDGSVKEIVTRDDKEITTQYNSEGKKIKPNSFKRRLNLQRNL